MLKRLEGPIWIVLGIVISLLSYRTGIGSFTEPGAGFIALASGLFIIVVGCIMSLVKTHGPRESGATGPPAEPHTVGRRFLKLVYIPVLLVLYGLFLEPVGYLIATFFLMFGLFFNLEKRLFAVPLLTSAACVAVTYLVFEIWLKTQLPRGVFPWW